MYTALMMRNYCLDCDDILIDPTEFRWGYCLICLAIRLEKMDVDLMDFYWDDDGDAI